MRCKLRVGGVGVEAEIEDPLAKAVSFGERVVSMIANRPSLQRVTVRGVAVFPEISREQGLARGVDDVVAPEQALFKDDLREAKLTEEYLPRFLLRVHDGGAGEDLEPEQIDELRGILHPEIVVGPAPEQGSLFTTTAKEPVVKVMDRRQERLSRKLGTGHRLIRGVAGSGKTLILLHRARFIARSFPNDRVLVTCFTRALASSLGALLDEFPNIEVRTINQVMASAMRDAGLANPADKGDWDAVAGVALEAVERRSPDPYRAVLIDEAQDFTTEELRFCTRLFASDDPEEQDLLVVADRAQNIFSRNFTWKGAGISVAGRSTVMRTNYRNTREILEFAHAFLIDDPDIDVGDGDDVDALSIVPAESAERSGEPVRVELVDDVGIQVDSIVAQVACWHSDTRAEPRSIAVLMQSESVGNLGKRLAERLKSEGVDYFWVGDPADGKGKDRVGFATAPVVLSTVHSSKGLEFPKVIVTGMMEGKSIDAEPARSRSQTALCRLHASGRRTCGDRNQRQCVR
ncbi:MAG: AAA family ATPase [Microthrixaceae bacterium]